MKKLFTIIALSVVCAVSYSQNVQLHYDLGHTIDKDLTNRQSVTTTVEMFKADKLGNTFFFTDIDYQKDGVMGAYWEISREFNVSKNGQWAVHAEYDGGITSDKESKMATRFQHAFLCGAAWNWAAADFSKTFSLQAMYKYHFNGQNAWNRPFSSFQATMVWGITFAEKLCTFAGFCDVWYDKSVNGNWIVVSEPQFWFNLNALKGFDGINLSLGTEVELSNNFVFDENGRNNRFYAIPTVAAKWTF